MLPRQSTTEPNVSNTTIFDASRPGFTLLWHSAVCARAGPDGGQLHTEAKSGG